MSLKDLLIGLVLCSKCGLKVFFVSVRWGEHLCSQGDTQARSCLVHLPKYTQFLDFFFLPARLGVREMCAKVKFSMMRYCLISSLWQGHFSRDEDGLSGRKEEQESQAGLFHISQFLHFHIQSEGSIFSAVRGSLSSVWALGFCL